MIISRSTPAGSGSWPSEDMAKAAKKTIHPESITWIVVGDRALIEPKIRELGFTEITIIDGDGNIIADKKQ